MKPILEINKVSKKFRIGHSSAPYLSVRDSIISVFRRDKISYEEFYALNEVSFNVNPGESIGIIGKNGAGKSTLLKILSKITPPSSGSIVSRGRIASLLEVGTGFHAELNGRENIFLNGSILGMQRKEIESKFDEIVDFSGTEKFLDTPLKHYSSGMQLRLAFSVAAFLEPEILVIDEVLAVGDAEFQKKCLGKMDDVSKEGRTILFVSHQIGLIKQLCRKCVYLKAGEVDFFGDAEEGIEKYLSNAQGKFEFNAELHHKQNQEVYFKSIYMADSNEKAKGKFLHSEDVFIVFKTEGKNVSGYTLLVNIVNSHKTILFSAETKIESDKTILKISKHFLKEGNYSIIAYIHILNLRIEDKFESDISFNIVDLDSEWVKYNSVDYFSGNVIGNYEWVKK